MKKIRKTLPFDKKNEEDFLRISENIRNALDTISSNANLAATQNKLAKLAGCSRKTLYNRKWALEELRLIKVNRKSLKEKNTANVLSFNKTTEKGDICNNDLLDLIKTYKQQNGLLFDRIQDLEDLKDELERYNLVLEEENKTLKNDNKELRNELRLLKKSLNLSSNIIKIR